MFFALVRLADRLDWGFGNPNTTGTFLAVLLVAVWALPALVPERINRFRRVAKIARAGLCAAAFAAAVWLGWKELQTGSRGGAVAAFVGIFTMLALLARNWNRRKVICFVAAVAVALAAVFAAGRVVRQAERLTLSHSVGDASIGNRLKIWKWTPAMIADAPGGWGLGNAPAAFMEWYQDETHSESYTALVNSHLEWLVEFNFAARAAYLLAWALVLRLLWPHAIPQRAQRRFCAVAFGAWIALGTGGFFSTVLNEWPLWVIPVFLFITAVAARIQNRSFPSWKNLLLTSALPAAVVFLLFLLIGSLTSPMSVGEKGAYVKIGRGAPEVLILSGANAAETARQFRTSWRKVSGAPTVLRVASEGETLLASETPSFQKLVLLGDVNPAVARPLAARAGEIFVFGIRFAPDAALDSATLKKTRAFTGEFSNSAHLDAWRATGRLVEVGNSGDFIENWLERVFASENSTSVFDKQNETGKGVEK